MRNLLKGIINAVPDLIWVKDRDGIYTYCNRAFEGFVGHKEAALLGKSDYDLFDRELADFFRDHDRRPLQSGKPCKNEEWLCFANGYEGLFETIKSPLLNDAGECIGVIGIARDISELSRSTTALRKRMLEQRCLYDIFKLTEDTESDLDDSFTRIAGRIRTAFHTPENYKVSISYGDRHYGDSSEDWPDREEGTAGPRILLSREATSSHGHTLAIRVLYRTNRQHSTDRSDDSSPTADGSIFVSEEKELLTALTQRLAEYASIRESRALEEERKNMMETMFAQTTDAILFLDPSTNRFIDCNGRAYEQLGYSREEFMGLTIADIEASLDTEKIYCNFGRVMKGDSIAFETRHRCKDGTLMDVQITLRQIRLSGRPLLCAIWHDITSIKQREKLLNTITNAAQDAIIMIDRTGIVTFWNPAATTILGYEAAEVMGKHLHHLITPTRYLMAHQQAWPIFQHSGTGHAVGKTLELAAIRKDGSEIAISLSLSAVITEQGQYAVGIVRDITQLNKQKAELIAAKTAAEEANAHKDLVLSQLEERVEQRTEELTMISRELDAIFNSVTTGIALINNRKIVRCNRRMEQIFGFGPAEMVGLSTRIWYLSEDEYEQVGRQIDAEMQDGGIHITSEREVRRRDGTTFWMRSQSRYLDPAQPELGSVASFEDISTERMTNEALRQARDAAEAASRAKSEFLANMSHEIRTPLNAITGITYLLRHNADPGQMHHLDKINSAARHLLGIINDILDFSKIEAGRMELSATNFDPGQAITTICSLLAEKADQKGLEFRVRTSKLPHLLNGDGLRLEQILLNYLSNAIKFTEQGSVTLDIRPLKREEKRIWMRFTVADTGPGLSAEQKDRIFRPFEQGDSSTTRKYGGTGLGLAITRRLAEMMQGRVGVESSGTGSIFWAELPFGMVAEQGDSSPIPEELDLRVLIIDDNLETCEALQLMLQDLGLSADVAHTGQEGIDRLQAAEQTKEPYTLLLLDLRMPEMDGRTVLARLDASGLHSSLQIILISGVCNIPELGRLSHRVGSVLTKPVTPPVLINAISGLFGLNKGGQGNRGDRSTSNDIVWSHNGQIQQNRISDEHRGQRLLLVEDNALNQEVALDMLLTRGFMVDIAENGVKACELASTTSYDLILMDVQMPVMDGLEATRHIVRLPRHAKTPIIAMTANAFSEDRERCLDAGMVDHIAKPVDPAVLFQALNRWLPPLPVPPPLYAKPPENKAASDHTLALLRSIEGLDLQAGLNSVLNRPERLLWNLCRFTSMHGDDARMIEQALIDGELTTGIRVAHSMKGVAATFGLTGLHHSSRELESCLKRHQSHQLPMNHDTPDHETPAEALQVRKACREKLDAFAASLQQTITGLEKIVTATSTDQQNGAEPAATDTRHPAPISDDLSEGTRTTDATGAGRTGGTGGTGETLSKALRHRLGNLLELLSEDALEAGQLCSELSPEVEAVFGPAFRRELENEVNNFAYEEAAELLRSRLF